MADHKVEAAKGLAAKLDSLDLTSEETALLDLLFERAAGDDVSGFVWDDTDIVHAKGSSSPTFGKLGGALGWSWGETNSGSQIRVGDELPSG